MKKIMASKRNQVYLLMAVAGCVILLFDFLTPLLADDYIYTFSRITGERMEDGKDMVLSMYDHYMVWGGRVITHMIASVFLFLPKIIFNVCNTAVYLAFTWLVYRFATIHCEEDSPLIYGLVHLGLWFFLPNYGQDILWLIGACNYLWPGLFILAFVWPYYKYALTDREVPARMKAVLWPLLGLLAGWGNENTSGAGILLVLCMLLVCRMRRKAWKIWHFTGLAGQVAGFVLLIAAPGNFSRLEWSMGGAEISFLMKITGRLHWCLEILELYILPLLILCAAVFALLFFCCKRKEQIMYSGMLFVTGLACNFAMVASPEYPERALFGTVMFLLIGALYVLTILLKSGERSIKMASAVLTSVALLLFAMDFTYAFMDITYTYRSANRRAESILEQVEAGEKDIVTYKITPENAHNAGYNLADIEIIANYWTNEIVAKYYGIDTIVSYQE